MSLSRSHQKCPAGGSGLAQRPLVSNTSQVQSTAFQQRQTMSLRFRQAPPPPTVQNWSTMSSSSSPRQHRRSCWSPRCTTRYQPNRSSSFVSTSASILKPFWRQSIYPPTATTLQSGWPPAMRSTRTPRPQTLQKPHFPIGGWRYAQPSRCQPMP